jgi:response regulator RpfG family c-di-GMP phosphodiesterase
MTMAEHLPETGGERARLLFVDDEQRVLNSMRIMFRRQFDLFLASHGAEALDIVKDKDIDVIVADHRMPRMTGVEVLSKVRAMSPRTVRILLTGYADLDAVEGSINESEVFRFLTKPCAPKQLRETIELAAKLARETPAPEPKAVLTPDTVEIILEATRSPRSAAHRARISPPPRDLRPRARGSTARLECRRRNSPLARLRRSRPSPSNPRRAASASWCSRATAR